ncbi:FecCD family ABC transporter permease [Corynebacterium lizhenjunii]|uniref:FecCD family ABC transporter permease n=1 Tax=Corynebacterium lizhenjunii TaxID=2709394 RepID=UPI0013EA0BEF|nr:iron chelate uptake ABC transporter family permease subunit [Corynebacterium lizhenjunii]
MNPQPLAPAPAGQLLLRARGYSLLLNRRSLVVSLALMTVCLVLMFAAIGVGGSSLSYADAWAVLTGHGTASQRLVIVEWRLPRILLAVIIGAALAVAGAIFQTITRNPLGSPDIIGFTMGAQAGVLVAIVLLGSSLAVVSFAALLGGIACGAVIFVVSFKGGFGGLRLILAGIAISAMVGSFNRWLIVKADSDTAYAALKAVTGTLAAAEWQVTSFALVATLVVLGLITACARDLRNLELGQDLAAGLGTHTQRAQAALVLLGTALVAIATTAAGPIGFIALVAPHLARMMSQSSRAPLVASGLSGAVLLLAADIASQALLESMPVGVVTAAVGGVYFMGLLVVESRKSV